MKIGVSLAGLVVVAGMTAIPCSAQSPEKIVDEYVRAIGGEKAVAAQRTIAISGSVRVKGAGDEDSPAELGTYSLVVKAPNKFYSEFGVGSARDVVAFNGKSGWQKDGANAAVTLTGAGGAECEAEARYLNGKLVHLKRDKIGARLVGLADVHSQKAYQVELAFSPAVKRELFFDTDTHLLVREIAPVIGASAGGDAAAAADGSQSVQIDYFDYRAASGVLEPQSMEITRGGKTYTVSVTHVERNGSANDAIFNFPSNDKRPLPDIPQLLRDLNANQRAIEEIQKHYTCHLTVEELKVDSKGDVTSKTVKEYDDYFVGDDEVRRLVAKDGKPLEGDEKKKEEERFSKQFDELKKKQAELQNDPKKQEKQQERDDEQISDFLRAETFTNPRREIFRGHEVIVFDFAANPDYKPRNLNEAIAQKLGGVVWVDEEARDVARLEARFLDSAKIGGGLVGSIAKGANVVIEQAKVNDEVWLPTYAEVHATARVAFVHFKANEIDRYTDYRKFGSEVRLGSATPLDGTGAPATAPATGAPAPAPSAPPQNATPDKPQ